MIMFNNIYRGKRVLITGHTGFKGSWLVFWLNQLGAEILGYSLQPPTNPNHYELLKLVLDTLTKHHLKLLKLISSGQQMFLRRVKEQILLKLL